MKDVPPADPLRVRRYGAEGPTVLVVHGGPGAPGSAAGWARALAGAFRVLEPFQRGSGGEPLTVARHVADLLRVISDDGREKPVALVGHSWGAMLALAAAAEEPDRVAGVALVGCGTFDAAARRRFESVRASRIGPELGARLRGLEDTIADPDARLQALGDLLLPAYSYALLPGAEEEVACDARAHEESWSDMLRLQDAGVYPAAFRSVSAPVLMLHGAADPHPGRLIRSSLRPYLRRLEYRELARCGHVPWREREARDLFLSLLRGWLRDRFEEVGAR